MFKRYLPGLLLVIIACNLHAQNLSKWGVEIRPFIYTDDYGIATYNWPHLFADGYAPMIDQNGLVFGSKPKEGSFPSLNDGWGVRVDIVRRLFPIKGSTYNRVDWSLGVGYRSFKTQTEHVPYNDGFKDTTVVYQLNSLKRKFSQRYVDVQSKAVYKIMKPESKFGLYVGVAMQLSLAVGGKVEEDFIGGEARWNTTSRTWMRNAGSAVQQNAPAKKISYFSWGIPVGLIIKLSKHMSLLPELTYWHNTNRQYHYPDNFGGRKKSFSESGYFSIAVRYDL